MSAQGRTIEAMNMMGGPSGGQSTGGDHQPALLDTPDSTPAPKLPAGTTDQEPVAQVILDSAVPHLDRPFDYAVPHDLAEKIVPGCRVKVRFSGREMSGYVVSRTPQPTTAARLSLIHKLITAAPVLAPDIRQLAEQVAARTAGVTSDVLRAAVPARAARVEKEFTDATAAEPVLRPEEPGPRWAELALKGYGENSWTRQVLVTVRECLESGGDAVVVVPDQRDMEQVAELLETEFGDEKIARLSADMGPTPRYRSFLRLRYGQARVAVGTRTAIFAPVARLRLMMVIDDDDASHVEPRAPYHQVRDVALLRSVQTGAGLCFLSASRSLEVQRLVERGWLQDNAADRETRRFLAPHMVSTADSYHRARDAMAQRARIPEAAYRTARQALEHGPVLVQVGRSGFIPAVLCTQCNARAQCPQCQGPLSLPAHHAQSHSLRCRWCGLHHRNHHCAECGNAQFRAAVRGADRTAQELGRAFPQIPVVSSTGDRPVSSVGTDPVLVVSTPGVEPLPEAGYSAALLLDGNLQLAREGLDVPRQVLGRWLRAASLVRPHRKDPAESGTVILTADDDELTGAAVRWDPVGYARRELYRRLELGLPPAKRMLSLTAEPAEAEALLAEVSLPAGVEWIGPAPVETAGEAEETRHRWLLFFSYAQAADVLAELRRARRTSSATPSGRGRAARIAVDDAASLQF